MAVAALAGGIPAGMLPVAGPGAEAAALPGRPASGTVPAAPQEGTSEGGVVTVNGSGFGHGVGMSQYGALGMARAGRSTRSILTHFYSRTTVGPYPDSVDLRVNVVDRGTSVSLSTGALESGGGALQLVTGGGRIVDLRPGSTVGVEIEGGGLKVTTGRGGGAGRSFTTGGLTVRWSGARGLAGPASLLKVTSRSANAGSTWSKARTYRWGTLRLVPVARADSDGVTRTRVAAVVSLNLHREYLSGIAEVPASWLSAALQAQVIAARNYALAKYRAGTADVCGGCHLWDDTRSQVYRGWMHESVAPRWTAAVTATQTSRTHGLTVLYRGSPIPAYYSSSSGGRTRDAASAWGSSVPYLRSVTDPWSVDPSVNPSYARWRRDVPRSRVASLFGLPDVTSVKVTERDAAGAVVTVVATSSTGAEATLPGGSVRRGLDLPAPWFSSFEVPQS